MLLKLLRSKIYIFQSVLLEINYYRITVSSSEFCSSSSSTSVPLSASPSSSPYPSLTRLASPSSSSFASLLASSTASPDYVLFPCTPSTMKYKIKLNIFFKCRFVSNDSAENKIWWNLPLIGTCIRCNFYFATRYTFLGMGTPSSSMFSYTSLCLIVCLSMMGWVHS